MAELLKFPGTEMDIFEKYPLSRRLDHPNFGDVAKTTYAKGVISDFKKVQDDPLQVQPLVKVTGDFGESDYIPIFFHPKPQYWDDPDHKATDLNQDEGYFEKAWMSFRGGDEVAVMLKEEKPVAVVGFADGVPRIGESIVKCDFTNYHAFLNLLLATNGLVGQIYYDDYNMGYNPDTKGPDGKDLKLLQECEYSVEVGEESNTVTWEQQNMAGVGGDYWTAPEGDGGVNKYFYNVRFAFWRKVGVIRKDKVRLLIKIGPIEFIVYLDVDYNFTQYDQTNHIFGGSSDDGTYENPVGGSTDPGTTPGLSSMGDQVSGSIDWTANNPDYHHSPPSWSLSLSLTAPPAPYGNVQGSTTLKKITARIFRGDDQNEIEQTSLDNDQMRFAWNGNNFKPGLLIKVRPHTKKELQAAGMWPAGVA
jgi:hypothetical protein